LNCATSHSWIWSSESEVAAASVSWFTSAVAGPTPYSETAPLQYEVLPSLVVKSASELVMLASSPAKNTAWSFGLASTGPPKLTTCGGWGKAASLVQAPDDELDDEDEELDEDVAVVVPGLPLELATGPSAPVPAVPAVAPPAPEPEVESLVSAVEMVPPHAAIASTQETGPRRRRDREVFMRDAPERCVRRCPPRNPKTAARYMDGREAGRCAR
jgi:hypothetical protein